jgi:hypothetical protein
MKPSHAVVAGEVEVNGKWVAAIKPIYEAYHSQDEICGWVGAYLVGEYDTKKEAMLAGRKAAMTEMSRLFILHNPKNANPDATPTADAE